jgi:ABC-2 type transport system ATP-binding protein
VSANAAPWVHAEGLTKRYATVTALNGCSLTVQQGEVFGLLGPNGAGKTTFLRLLLGYLRPTAGTATIGGYDCVRESLQIRRLTAYLPGDARLFPTMNGRDVLEFFAATRGESLSAASVALAGRLELDLSRRVAYMSTGMRQKLALAACLAANTPLVILDEPTANLDPNVRSTVLALVREARRAGRTVIFSSHVMAEVEEACDAVAILRQGQVVHRQSLAQLRQQHRIRAALKGPWQPPPDTLAAQLHVRELNAQQVVLETPSPLAPLLGWLATLPLDDLRIEPLGLQAVYDRHHASSP